MKKHLITLIILSIFRTTYSQNLILKGKVKCATQSASSTKGANNIVVVPAFMPSKATITLTQPSGYFEINTGVPISKIQDKTVSIYGVSACKTCSDAPQRIFVSEDQDRQNRNDNKRYVTIKEWQLMAICNKAELKPFAADSLMRILAKQPDQDLEKISSLTALTGAPTFLNLLTKVIQVASALQNFGTFKLFTVEAGKINYGQMNFSSPLYHSANTGFNFSPTRNMDEAAFWNPSAIAFSRKPNNISLITNAFNNAKMGGFYRINDKITVGGGMIYSRQDEFRKAVYEAGGNQIKTDTTTFKVQEYASYLSPVYQVNNAFSIGLTLKSVWQNHQIPQTLEIKFVDGKGVGFFTDSTIVSQKLDLDISATYKINNAINIGLNLMNLTGSKLYSDAFIPNKKDNPIQNQRALGLGLNYKLQKLNLGTDLLFTEAIGFYDATIGANFVPFNNALVSAGFGIKQKSYSAAFRLKHFRIAYINDNNFLINEKRVSKFLLLNGRIYGGFVFDLE